MSKLSRLRGAAASAAPDFVSTLGRRRTTHRNLDIDNTVDSDGEAFDNEQAARDCAVPADRRHASMTADAMRFE
jgi:hypothetical protein